MPLTRSSVVVRKVLALLNAPIVLSGLQVGRAVLAGGRRCGPPRWRRSVKRLWSSPGHAASAPLGCAQWLNAAEYGRLLADEAQPHGAHNGGG
eukprot:UN4477